VKREISTPPSAPVAWRCYKLTPAPDGICGLISEPIHVASRTWFDARSFAAAHFSTSPSELWCELMPLEEARDALLDLLLARAIAALEAAAPTSEAA
jgi:hypothetical protein